MGFSFASWASRIPQVRTELVMNPAQFGLVLLCMSVGALLGIPLSGAVVSRIGAARTVTASVALLAAGLALVAAGTSSSAGCSVVLVAIGLLVFGAGSGVCDVAANVQGAEVERILRRSVLARFHAAYCVGTVAGAGLAALLIATGVTVVVHLLVTAVLIALVMPASALRGFLTHQPPSAEHPSNGAALRAWRERRTLLIGVFVLCMAFTEGTGYDWLSQAIISGYRTPVAVGTVELAVFMTAMTLGRWFGPRLLDRYGRVPVLRGCALLALGGVLLVVFGGLLPVAVIGAVLWGCGTALGFPTGISAASDDQHLAAARVTVATSIGYLAFLGGPPLIGEVANHVEVRSALLVVAVLLFIALLTSRVCARRGPAPRNDQRST
jgi:predicted MFS family arabinose efflux permease